MKTKTVFCLIPRPLVQLVYPTNELHNGKCLFVGWVWLKRAKLTKNMVHGWLAFVVDQVGLERHGIK